MQASIHPASRKVAKCTSSSAGPKPALRDLDRNFEHNHCSEARGMLSSDCSLQQLLVHPAHTTFCGRTATNRKRMASAASRTASALPTALLRTPLLSQHLVVVAAAALCLAMSVQVRLCSRTASAALWHPKACIAIVPEQKRMSNLQAAPICSAAAQRLLHGT